MLRWERYW